MLNTNISEIMNQENLCTFAADDTVNTFLSSVHKNNSYLVDSQNNLTGVINEQNYLQFLSPMLPLLERETSDVFMERLGDVPVSAIAEKNYAALNRNSTLSETIQELVQAKQPALPVVDEHGKLIGEVTYNSVISLLGSNDKGRSSYADKNLRVVS